MKNLFRLCLPAFMAVVLVTLPLGQAPAQEAAQEIKPVAVISIAGSDELLGDIGYITEAAGAGDFGRLAALMATPYTAPLDRKKPIGAYVVLSDQNEPAAVGFIPVKDLDVFLAALKEQIGEPEDAGDGVLEIGTDRPQPMFVKEQKGWAFVSNKKEMLENLPRNPTKLLGGLNKDYTLAVRVNVSNLPEGLRQMAVQQLRKGFNESIENVRDDKAAEIGRKLGEGWVDAFITLVEDTEAVTLGFEIDAESQTTHIDITVTAVEGTKLAEEMATVEEANSAFAGFLLPDAAATFHAAGKSAETDVEQMLLLLDVIREEAMKGIEKDNDLDNDEERDTAKAIVGQFLDIAEQTVKARTVNCGGVLVLKPNSLAAALGGFVSDGDALEQAIGELWDFAKEKDPNVRNLDVNTQTHRGVTLNTINVPLKDQKEEAREVLGDPLEVVLGVGEKSVYLAFGKESTDLLKQILDKSAEDAGGKFAPGEVNVSLTPILEFAASIDDNPGVQTALESLKAADGKDNITLTVMPAKRGVTLRFAVEEGVISAAGEAGKAIGPLMGASR
ncbi:MAG: hypothetical protein H8E44_15835 [Planctomycetes bacterium]|nr:hypothetical protein [Planctomycetota bacterium]